jgi:hypothetical protein
MLSHSVSISANEEELGFAILNLPSTENAARWNGKFARVCAKAISESCYVMKFEGESGPEYYQVKWGVSKNVSWLSPMWIPAGQSFTDPGMAIQSAAVDLTDWLNVIEYPLPKPDSN